MELRFFNPLLLKAQNTPLLLAVVGVECQHKPATGQPVFTTPTRANRPHAACAARLSG